MRWIYLAIIFSLGTLIVISQDAATLPHFSELLHMELGAPIIDNEARLIYRYEESGKIEFAFPDEVNQVWNIRSEDSTHWLLIERNEDGLAEFWHLDWQGGEFSRVNNLCEGVAGTEATILRYEESRIILLIQEEGLNYLCYFPSGERIEIPAVSTSSFSHYDNTEPRVSPDGRYVVTLVYELEETQNVDKIVVYSFDTVNQQLLILGEIEYGGIQGDRIGIGRWIDEHYFLIGQGSMPEWSSNYTYVADAGRENSLNLALRGWRYGPVYHDDPPQFEYMISVLSDGPSPGPCILAVYDIYANTHYEYDTGSFCDYGWIVPNGNGERIYRAYYPRAGVVSFNPVTGGQRVIYVGEVEGIYGLSPDGHYALIALDDGGVISNPQDIYDSNMAFVPTEYFVLDIINGGFPGSVPAEGEWISGNAYLATIEGISILYEINEAVSATALNGVVLASNSDGKLYVFNEEAETISLYDRESQNYQLLVSGLAEWRPRLVSNEQGFSLQLSNDTGEQQNYIIAWR